MSLSIIPASLVMLRPIYKQRTGKVVPICDNCKVIFNKNI